MSENLRKDLDKWLDFECVEYNSGSTGIEYAIPLDVVEDKLLELQNITAADVPEYVKREIQAEALEAAANKYAKCVPYNWRQHILNEASKLRESKQ